MAAALADMNMKVMASEMDKDKMNKAMDIKNSHTKALASAHQKTAKANLQSLYKQKEAKPKQRTKSEEEEDQKILNFGAFGGAAMMSFGVAALVSDKSIFQMDTSKAMSMLGKMKALLLWIKSWVKEKASVTLYSCERMLWYTSNTDFAYHQS